MTNTSHSEVTVCIWLQVLMVDLVSSYWWLSSLMKTHLPEPLLFHNSAPWELFPKWSFLTLLLYDPDLLALIRSESTYCWLTTTIPQLTGYWGSIFFQQGVSLSELSLGYRGLSGSDIGFKLMHCTYPTKPFPSISGRSTFRVGWIRF